MERAGPPVSFACSRLSEARHVCAFFNRDDEEYRVLVIRYYAKLGGRAQRAIVFGFGTKAEVWKPAGK